MTFHSGLKFAHRSLALGLLVAFLSHSAEAQACPGVDAIKIVSYIFGEGAESNKARLKGIVQKAVDEWNAANQKPLFSVLNHSTVGNPANVEIFFEREIGGKEAGFFSPDVDVNGCLYDQNVIAVQYGTSDEKGRWQPYCDSAVLEIVKHELGHALGFTHTNNPEDIMYPTLRTKDACPELLTKRAAPPVFKPAWRNASPSFLPTMTPDPTSTTPPAVPPISVPTPGLNPDTTPTPLTPTPVQVTRYVCHDGTTVSDPKSCPRPLATPGFEVTLAAIAFGLALVFLGSGRRVS